MSMTKIFTAVLQIITLWFDKQSCEHVTPVSAIHLILPLNIGFHLVVIIAITAWNSGIWDVVNTSAGATNIGSF